MPLPEELLDEELLNDGRVGAVLYRVDTEHHRDFPLAGNETLKGAEQLVGGKWSYSMGCYVFSALSKDASQSPNTLTPAITSTTAISAVRIFTGRT